MALQSKTDQVSVSYISREDEKVLSARETIILSRHNDSISAMIR